MTPEQKTWIEERDEVICRALENNPSIEMEAFMWCGHPDIKWDKDRLPKLTPLLLEYGKSEELIQAMRETYKSWMKDK